MQPSPEGSLVLAGGKPLGNKAAPEPTPGLSAQQEGKFDATVNLVKGYQTMMESLLCDNSLTFS